MTTETVQKWLKSQCNRYANGYCGTLACLVRGGYDRKHVESATNFDMATCEAHEALKLIDKAKAEQEAAQ